MDTQLLRTFLEVSRTRHFGQAAESLHLTSAAVSARIRQLEDYLGVSLFTRQRGNIQLTAAGQRLLSHAESILSAWSFAREDIQELCPVSSSLRIGVQSVLNQRVLPFSFEASLSEQSAPDQSIEQLTVSYADRQRLQEGLQMQLFDLIILIDAVEDAQIQYQTLFDLKCVLVSDQENRNIKQALQEDYIQMEWGEAFTAFQTQRFGAQAKPVLRTDNLTLALRYLKEKGGSCFLPEQIAADEEGYFPVLDAPRFERPVRAVYLMDAVEPDLIQQAIQHYF